MTFTIGAQPQLAVVQLHHEERAVRARLPEERRVEWGRQELAPPPRPFAARINCRRRLSAAWMDATFVGPGLRLSTHEFTGAPTHLTLTPSPSRDRHGPPTQVYAAATWSRSGRIRPQQAGRRWADRTHGSPVGTQCDGWRDRGAQAETRVTPRRQRLVHLKRLRGRMNLRDRANTPRRGMNRTDDWLLTRDSQFTPQAPSEAVRVARLAFPDDDDSIPHLN